MINTITYIVSTLFTYIMGLLSKKYGWNKELPIPVQNVLVGIAVFGIVLIYTYFSKIPINVESIIEQIICAIGGSGTATLYYDNKKVGD